MNDDPVVGTLWEHDPHRHAETVYLSDLDDEYKAMLYQFDAIVEQQKMLTDRILTYQDRIAKLEARLAKAEAALEAADELHDAMRGITGGELMWSEYRRLRAEVDV